MKYLILGSGYVGGAYMRGLDGAVVSRRRILKPSHAQDEIIKYKPDWVINCIGVSGRPNVDWCEDHKPETFFGNVLVPIEIAKASAKTGVPMLHIGSGCVYSGDRGGLGFREDDPPNFAGSFYSKTKAISEDLLKDYDTLQVRIRMPIDSNLDNERNLVNKLTGYGNVISVKNSITILEDMVYASSRLMEKDMRGLYNVVNPGPMTHPEILDLYKEVVDPTYSYKVVSQDSLQRRLKARRSNCVLNTRKLSRLVKLKPLRPRLRQIFRQYRGKSGGTRE
jgi:dTDP-4-dehydrorhamnose reductase